jgi:hypothetical protein
VVINASGFDDANNLRIILAEALMLQFWELHILAPARLSLPLWQKTRPEFSDALQAATLLAVEEVGAQWTMYKNLNEWVDDLKEDILLATILAINKDIFNTEKESWCQRFE